MKTLTVKMPAFLASALVNGDTSGLECSCGGPKCGGCGEYWPCTVARNPAPYRSDIAAQHYPRPDVPAHTGQCDFYWLAAAHKYVAPGHVIDVERSENGEGLEAHFSRYCDLPGWHLGADMLDYVVIYPEGK